jgi:hypothetical protein
VRVFFRRNIFYIKFFWPVVNVPPPLPEIVATITYSGNSNDKYCNGSSNHCDATENTVSLEKEMLTFMEHPSMLKCSKQYSAGSYPMLIKSKLPLNSTEHNSP